MAINDMAALGDEPEDNLNEISTLDGDLRIGDYLVRPLLKKVVHLEGTDDGESAEEHSLPDKAMGVLLYLAEHAHHVCERAEILDTVWGEDREAYDRVLDNAVAEIRRVFGDDARKPSYVQTVPRRGYRLLVLPRFFTQARASETLADAAQPTHPSPIASPQRTDSISGGRKPARWTRSASVVVLLGAIVWTAWKVLPEDQHVRTSFEAASSVRAGLLDQLRRGVMQEHPCAEKNLLRHPNWLTRADFVVSVSSKDEESNPSLAATIRSSSSNWKQSTFVSTASSEPDLPAALNRDVRAALDEQVCNSDIAASEDRACHCLSAATAQQTKQRPDQAAELLERAVRLDPGSLAAYEAMIPVLFYLGESERVASALRSGMERLGTLESDIAIQLRRRLAQVQHDHDTEWEMIQTMAKRYPDDKGWRVETAAFLLRNRNDCQSALEILQPIAASDPADLRIKFETVKTLLRCGRGKEGVDILREIVAQSRRNAEARLWLAVASISMGRWDEAQSLAQEVLALQPDNPVSYWLLGTIARAKGHHTETLQWAQRAAKLAKWPQDQLLADDLVSSTCRRTGDVALCLESTENYRDNTGPWGYTPMYERGFCLLEAGRMDEAKELLRLWEVLHSPRGSRWEEWLLLSFKGAIQARSADSGGSVELAAQLFEQSVEFDSAGPENPYVAAAELESAGQHERAEAFYELALRRNPNHPWTHCRLGLRKRDEGRADEAIYHLRQAIDVFGIPPEDPLGVECAKALAELDPTFTVAH